MSYVGQTRNYDNRTTKHLNEIPRLYIDRALQKRPCDFIFSKLFEVHITDEDLNDAECWFIGELQTMYPDGYNMTEGGVGGRLVGEAYRKWREVVSSKEFSAKMSSCLKELWKTTEYREHQIESQKLAQACLAVRERKRAGIITANKRAEVKARRTAAMKALHNRPDVKKRKSEKMKTYWADKRKT